MSSKHTDGLEEKYWLETEISALSSCEWFNDIAHQESEWERRGGEVKRNWKRRLRWRDQ